MFGSWSTAAVAVSEYEEGGGIDIHGFVLGDGTLHVAEVCLRGVGFARRHVAEDLRSVEGDPVECGVWEFVDVVP